MVMDLFDKLAFMGRRYERDLVPRNGSHRFTLSDLLQAFNYNTILELTPIVDGKAGETVKPDEVRKLKVSLLDHGIAAIHSHADDGYEVYRTAPSGDLSKVRVVAYSPKDDKIGELHMLVSERLQGFYFDEDPILDRISQPGNGSN